MQEVKLVDPRELRPHPANSRRHPRDQINALIKGFVEFGFRGVVVIDEAGTILAGHGRTQAAIEAGLERIPAQRVSGWSEAKKRAFVIADNQLGLASEWDEERLASELRALVHDEKFDGSVLGFGDQELNELIARAVTSGEGEEVAWTEDDQAPSLPAANKVVSRVGDLWICGPHRVLCGDSTKPADLATLVGAEALDLWITDPPYNVAYTGGTKDALTIQNDSMDDGRFRQFLIDAYKAADAVMKPGAVFYIWHADSEGLNFRTAAREAGWPVRQCLIWRKNALVMGRQDYHWQHEPCLYGWKPGAAHQWFGGRKQTTVAHFGQPSPFLQLDDSTWQLSIDGRVYLVRGDAAITESATSVINEAKPQRNAEHPTMKPVSLFERQILNSTKTGDIVGDSFGGSGTTIIACQKAGRRARLMELDPRYVDVIVKRWQEHAGSIALHAASGAAFDQVAVDRGVMEAA